MDVYIHKFHISPSQNKVNLSLTLMMFVMLNVKFVQSKSKIINFRFALVFDMCVFIQEAVMVKQNLASIPKEHKLTKTLG